MGYPQIAGVAIITHPTSNTHAYLSETEFHAIASAADFVDESTRDTEEEAIEHDDSAGEIQQSQLAEW